MLKFRNDFYADVRYETVTQTAILYLLGDLQSVVNRGTSGAFLRVFDGKRWYYCATSETDRIQDELDRLYAMGTPNPSIADHPIVKRFRVHKAEKKLYTGMEVSGISIHEKDAFLRKTIPLLQRKRITFSQNYYMDRYVLKHFVSSLGADVTHDWQVAGIAMMFSLSEAGKTIQENYESVARDFRSIEIDPEAVNAYIDKCEHFLLESKPVVPGSYPVILAPQPTGIFAHESFGHKSEADFMIGDERMKQEWQIGRQVGASILNIVDDGRMLETGYCAYDDEGCPAAETHLIRNGKLAGRLHSANTAADLDEEPTGNARAINFEYEPIVRMTNTYIVAGSTPKDQLFEGIEHGYYIEKVRHGSGMSTFTMAPSLAYRIENGKVTHPVQISVVTGSVFETLNLIEDLSSEYQVESMILGGCGKYEQYPLLVGVGGPHVRIKSLTVQ